MLLALLEAKRRHLLLLEFLQLGLDVDIDIRLVAKNRKFLVANLGLNRLNRFHCEYLLPV